MGDTHFIVLMHPVGKYDFSCEMFFAERAASHQYRLFWSAE